MLQLAQTFSIPSHAAGKIMDGELVVINLQNGLYYSSSGTGAKIWQLLEAGASIDQIATALTTLYQLDRLGLETDILQFVGTLQERALITEASVCAADSDIDSIVSAWAIDQYASPSILTFDDMEQAFAIDPPILVKG